MPASLPATPTATPRVRAPVRSAGARFGQVLAGVAATLLALAPAPVLAAAKQTPAQKEAELRKLNQRIDKVRKTVNGRALNTTASDVAVVPATFGPKAAVMGAVSLILSGVVNLDYGHFNFSEGQ